MGASNSWYHTDGVRALERSLLPKQPDTIDKTTIMTLTLPPAKHYHPFQPGPFRMAMHLFPLDLVEWIEIDTDLPAHLAEKRRLLAERPTEVFATQPQALAGIYNDPFATLSNQPEAACRLAAAIAGLNERMTGYKSLRPIRNAAIAWLEGCGATNKQG